MRSYTSNATRARNDKGVIKKKERSIRERVRGVCGVPGSPPKAARMGLKSRNDDPRGAGE